MATDDINKLFRDDCEIYNMDCLDGMARLGPKSIDHIIGDPEYSEHIHEAFGTEQRNDGTKSRGEIGFDCLTEEKALLYSEQYVRIARRWIILFTDEVGLVIWKNALEKCGAQYIRKGTWVKTNPSPQMSGDRPSHGTEEICIAHAPRDSGRMRWNGGGKPATYHFPVVQGEERIHHAQKPKPLLSAIIKDFTDFEEIVLDSHIGSGTTGISAIEQGRKFIGFEKDPSHFAKAEKRIKTAQRQQTLFKPMKQEKLFT